MQGFAHHPERHPGRWGTVRLRMTLWNVTVLALILGGMGGVVRYMVQTDLFARVDRTLAERAHSIIPRGVAPLRLGPGILSRMAAAVEGSAIGSKPGALPPLPPRVIPRAPAGGPGGES